MVWEDSETNSLKDCKTFAHYKEYLHTKAENHNCLKIYGSKKSIENIVKMNALCFSDGANWNDTDDYSRLKKESDDELLLARSFSFSKSENVAMWMLYATTERDLMINIRPSVILQLIEEKPDIIIGKWCDDCFHTIKTLTSLEYSFEYTDMLYSDYVSDKTAVKRSDERVEGISRDVMKTFGYLSKSYPWNYENECRLMIRIPKQIVYGLDINSAQVPLNHLKDNYSIYHNPQNEIADKYLQSTLRGTMKWNFENKNNFLHQ